MNDAKGAPAGVALEHHFSLQADAWSQPGPAAEPPLLVERGEDPSTAVVAFKGFGGMLNRSRFDFLSITGLLRHSRILLRDDSFTCYLAGIPGLAGSCESLAGVIRGHLAELAPARTMMIGPSGGSFAAILYGHLLGADDVHAFAPFTNLDPQWLAVHGDPHDNVRHAATIERLAALPPQAHRYFNLSHVLREWNGRTRYNIHACANSPREMKRAMRLEGLPGVTIHRHPCDTHRVVSWLAGRKRLMPLLRAENQQDVAAVVAATGATGDG
ncbi:MAG TPA: hypothetical protein VGR63_11800 [Casimicrobiaceae bacterium]|nr:hypothetical protein [Casimicrobiaceae bacterium]